MMGYGGELEMGMIDDGIGMGERGSGYVARRGEGGGGVMRGRVGMGVHDAGMGMRQCHMMGAGGVGGMGGLGVDASNLGAPSRTQSTGERP